MRTQPGQLHDSRQSSSSSLSEKGFIAAAIGVVLLISPYVLKGSASVNAVTTALQPMGWGALILGLLLMGLNVLRRRSRGARHVEDAPVSRFQHSVLPEELLNPPTRIRLEPMDDKADEIWRNSTTDPSSTMPSTLDTVPASLDPDVAPTRHTPRTYEWTAQVYEQIEWRRFEAVCEALFAQAGFQPKAQGLGSTGGVDLWLQSRHAQGPVALARCRHWLGRPVGVRELRDFHGKLSSNQLRRGSYVTSGGYTQEALEFAHAKGINLLDGTALLALIAKRRPEQQQTLLNIAYEGEYWRPSCASCGNKMVERGSEADGSAYWACINYPRCRNILPMMYPL